MILALKTLNSFFPLARKKTLSIFLNISGNSLQLLDERLLLLLDFVFALGAVEWSLVPSLLWILLALLRVRLGSWIFLDLGMGLFVHSLDTVSRDTVLDVLRELSLVRIIVIALKLLHVVGNMDTKYVLAMNVSLVFSFFLVEAWEALVAGKKRREETVNLEAIFSKTPKRLIDRKTDG